MLHRAVDSLYQLIQGRVEFNRPTCEYIVFRKYGF